MLEDPPLPRPSRLLVVDGDIDDLEGCAARRSRGLRVSNHIF